MAQAAPAIGSRDEYAVKAQLLVELTAYVKGTGPVHQGKPFVLAIIGVSPFGTDLPEYAAKHTVQGRPIEVQYWSWPRQARSCDMAFICRSEQGSALDILAWFDGRSVLTACESVRLTHDGVMVGVVLENNRVKIVLNRQAMAEQGFFPNSQLLGVATLVGPDRPAQ